MKKIVFGFICAITFLPFSGEGIYAAPPSVGEIFNIQGGEEGNTLTKEDKYLEDSGLRDYTFNPDKGGENKPGQKGDVKFRVMVEYAVKYLQKIFLVIAVLFFVWGGAELIIGKGDEEKFKTKKRLILSTAVGFIILLLAGIAVDQVFFGGEVARDASGKITGDAFTKAGNFLSNEDTAQSAATAGYTQLTGLFQYFTSWVVMAGVAYMIFSALKVIIAGGEDENQITGLKKRVVFSILGMIILVSTQKFISLFQDSDNKLSMPQADKIIELLVDWINFALGFVGILSIVALIWGGVRLVTSMGQDEQSVEDAKRTIFSSIIGLVIAFSAWTLMYYFAVV